MAAHTWRAAARTHQGGARDLRHFLDAGSPHPIPRMRTYSAPNLLLLPWKAFLRSAQDSGHERLGEDLRGGRSEGQSGGMAARAGDVRQARAGEQRRRPRRDTVSSGSKPRGCRTTDCSVSLLRRSAPRIEMVLYDHDRPPQHPKTVRARPLTLGHSTALTTNS